MPDHSAKRRGTGTSAEPGPARLYALTAGALLSLLGVLGFFYDAGFDTATNLAADDVAGLIVVNGWRNVVYLLSGMVALGFASSYPRPTAAALGLFYLAFGIWGALETDHDIGSILEVLPLTNSDNIFHLALGALGAIAALADGPLPALPTPKPKTKTTKTMRKRPTLLKRRRRGKPASTGSSKPEPGRKPLPKASDA